MNFNTHIAYRDWWIFRSPTYFNQIFVNGLTGGDGKIVLNGQDLYTFITTISGDSVQLTTFIQQNSAIWMSTYTTINNISADLVTYNNAISNVNLGNYNLSANNINTYNINISGNQGYTHNRKIVLMDEDGNSFEANLHGGIITII